MALIDWSSELVLGIAAIDEQHKKLIGIINDFHRGLTDGHANESIDNVLRQLFEYIHIHFSYEEKLLDEHAFPYSEQHCQKHNELIKQVEDFRDKLTEGRIMIGMDILSFLKDWILHHILEEDKAYVNFLTSKGVS